MEKDKPVIIGIHGLGNKPPKDLLEKWWKMSLVEGMLNYNKHTPLFDFELVYWADYVYPRPLNPDIKEPGHSLFIDEPYIKGEDLPHKEDGYFGSEIVDFLKKKIDQLILSDEFMQTAPSIAEKIIHKYFLEIELYFSSESIYKVRFAAKEVIRTRLAAVLEKYKNRKVLLIGHSMGSLIAYDVLDLVEPKIKIDTLITIGSPLGIPYIIDKIKAERNKNDGSKLSLKSPENILDRWYNFSDSEDKISTHFKLAEYFKPNKLGIAPMDQIVINNYTNGIEENPHKAYGYLRTKEVAEVVGKFVSANKSNGRLWMESKLSGLWYKKNLMM